MPWKYISEGSNVVGVPPRDLTDEEWELYSKAFEKREGVPLEKCGLYEKVSGKKAAPATAEGDDHG